MDIELSKIEPNPQTGETETKGSIRNLYPKDKMCIYYKDRICTIPECKYEICSKCPYGCVYSLKAILKDLFDKIIGLTIFLGRGDEILTKIIQEDKESS